MDAETIDSLTFAQFATQFSRGEISCTGRFTVREPEVGAWERAEMAKKHSAEGPLYYIGPIEDVDTAFNYISALNSERAFLYGGSERELAYLGLRLCLFAGAENMAEYYLNMINADEAEREKIWCVENPEKLIENVKEFDVPIGRCAVQGTEFMHTLGYIENVSPHMINVMYEPTFKTSDAVRAVQRIVRMAGTEDFRNSWLFPDNYQRVKEKVLQGRVKGFATDFPNGIAQAVKELSESCAIERLVLNVSSQQKSDSGNDELGKIYQQATDSVKPVFLL